MNNVILAIWLKDQDLFIEPPQIIYAYWMTFDHNLLTVYPEDGPTESIPLDIIGFISVVGQFDKGGREYRHHDDKEYAIMEA